MSVFPEVVLTTIHRLQREDAAVQIRTAVNAIADGLPVQTQTMIYKCATYVMRHFYRENLFRGGIVAMYTILTVSRSGLESMIPAHAVVDVY